MSLKILSTSLLAASLDLVLFAALAWVGARLLGRRSPRVAALLWVLVMVRSVAGLAGMSFPVDPQALGLSLPLVSGGSPELREEEVEVLRGGPGLRYTGTSVGWVSWRHPRQPALALCLAWAAGLAGFSLLALRDRLRLRRLVASAALAPPLLTARRDAVAARLGIQRPPALLVTEELESPALAGTVSPVILLPRWLAEEGTPEQLDWALGHELVHRKRRDPLAGAVRQAFQALFFFHPLAWWVGAKWEEAAELACDRALVRNEEEAASYAERLYEILVKARGRRRAALAGGLFATRTQIGRRIAALLKDPIGSSRLWPGAVLALALFALLSASVGFGGRKAPMSGDLSAELQLTYDGGTADFQAKGRVEFAADGRDVLRILPGGHVHLSETSNGITRHLTVRPGQDGRLERTYQVDGRRREYDREAREWVAATLPRFVCTLDKDNCRP